MVVVLVVVAVEDVDDVVEDVVVARLVVEDEEVVLEVSPGSSKPRPSCANAFLRCCGSGGERRGCGWASGRATTREGARRTRKERGTRRIACSSLLMPSLS